MAALALALLLPALTPWSALADETGGHSTPTARHISHLHHLHVLHLHTLAALRRAHPAVHAGAVRARILNAAESYVGVPYRHAGASRAGVDCSGLTQVVYKAAGIGIPRTTDGQQRAARHPRSPQVGDVLFYGSPAYHVAIVAAVRNGRVIDTIVARHTGTLVQHQAPYASYTVGTFI